MVLGIINVCRPTRVFSFNQELVDFMRRLTVACEI